MATRLQSGQIQLRSVTGVPMERVVDRQVDYMTAARQEAAGSSAWAQILDRMGATVNDLSARLRTQEGEQFAAENPITAEQVQLAKDGVVIGLGGGIGKVSGDFPTFFNAAVRKARGIELQTHFMSEYRNVATQVSAQLEDGTITLDQAKTKLNASQSGLAASLAKVMPDAALQFRAQAGMQGSTVLARGYELAVKRDKEQREIKFNAMWEQTKPYIEQIYSQGDKVPIDGVGPVITPEMQVDVIEQQINSAALVFGDKAMQDKMLGELRKARTEARINAVTKEFLQNDAYMADPEATLAKIKRGEAGNVSGTLQWMILNDFDSVAKVTANFMAAVTQRETIARNKRAEAKAADEREFAGLLADFVTAPEGSKKQIELRGKITDVYRRGSGAIPDATFTALFKKDGEGKGNASVWATLWLAIDDNKVTSKAEIDKHINQLSKSEYSSLIKHLSSDERRDASDLQRGLMKRAGIPIVPGGIVQIDPKGDEWKRNKELEAEALEIRARFAREGKPEPTTKQILDEIDDGISKRRNSEEAKSAKKSLELLQSANKNWITAPVTRETLPSLRQKAGSDPNKQRVVKTIEGYLDKVEGRR